MDKSDIILELGKNINTIYYIMSQVDQQWIEEELYPVVHDLERIQTLLENEE